MSWVSELYKLARTANTVNTLASGDPKRVTRRVKNIVVGRTLRRLGLWRWLWK